jgi:hypothetical protein
LGFDVISGGEGMSFLVFLKRILLLATVVWLSLCSGLSGSSVAQIPEEARERAVEFIKHDWARKIVTARSFFDLDDIEGDISSPELGHGFIVYKLNDQSTSEYISSSEVDPTVFATNTDYYFPVFANGQYLGSIMVIRNRDSKGEKLVASDGEYTFMGFTHRTNPNELTAIELQRRFPFEEGNTIGWVSTSGVNNEPFMIVKNKAGDMFLINLSDYELTPMAEAAARIKLNTREGRDSRRFS